MSLVDGFDFHIRTLERLGRSRNTLLLYRTYEQQYLSFLDDAGIAPSYDALSPPLVYEAQDWVRSRSRGHRSGVVAARTFVAVLQLFDRWAVDNDLYPDLRLARLRKPTVPKIRRKPFTEAETTRLVQAATEGQNSLRDRALLLLLFDTGCRIGELCAATVDDVDLSKGAIVFRHTKGQRPREVIFRDPTRRDGGRGLQALRQWLRVREAEPNERALFTTREGHGLSPRRARELFVELGSLARVPNCHPHRTRHAQPLYSPVLTPTGWKPIGDLRVGDAVIGSDGKATQVTLDDGPGRSNVGAVAGNVDPC